MKIWSRFPVFRILIPFSTGIICCIHLIANLNFAVAVALSGFLISFLFTRKNWATGKYAQRWLAGIPFYFCFWGLGFVVTWVNQSDHFHTHFKNYLSKKDSILIVEIYQPPVKTLKGTKLFTSVNAVKNAEKWTAVRGNLLIFIKDTSHQIACSPGDQLIVSCKPLVVRGPTNPMSFDYASYLHGKGIWHQAFTGAGNVKLLKNHTTFSLFRIAIGLRDFLLEKLKRFIKSNDELGVSGALLLGYEDWLDPDLENSYSMAGVLHVLCVSGMHVGLIYAVFAWSLSFMEKKKYLRILRYLLLILMTWFYALLTGFTPSVVRAAAMLTFVISGKLLNKEANIYNLLCSSCFLLFTMDPYIIMSAGFQLSFLAVCGIVFLHRMILPLWIPPNKLIFMIWELISISVAAQITTFPLSLFLFHQFPNYFLLGNLVIIPLSTLVMYSGLIFLITDWIPFVGYLTGTITSTGISWLNKMVVFLGKLPGAVTNNVYISFYELLGIYFLIFLIVLWIIFKWRSLFFAWMLTIIFVFSMRIYQTYSAEKTNILTVYDAGRQNLVSIITSRTVQLAGGQPQDSVNIKRIAGEHLISNLVHNTTYHTIAARTAGVFTLPDGSICVIVDGWERNDVLIPADLNKKTNLLILGGEIKIPVKEILKTIVPKEVIFASSVPGKQLLRLKKDFGDSGISTYDVLTSGAYRYRIIR